MSTARPAPVVVPAPCWPLDLQDLFGLLQEHRRAPLIVMRDDGNEVTLDGSPADFSSAVLRLALQALTIHAIVAETPHRPAVDVLSQAIVQTKWS